MQKVKNAVSDAYVDIIHRMQKVTSSKIREGIQKFRGIWKYLLLFATLYSVSCSAQWARYGSKSRSEFSFHISGSAAGMLDSLVLSHDIVRGLKNRDAFDPNTILDKCWRVMNNSYHEEGLMLLIMEIVIILGFLPLCTLGVFGS